MVFRNNPGFSRETEYLPLENKLHRRKDLKKLNFRPTKRNIGPTRNIFDERENLGPQEKILTHQKTYSTLEKNFDPQDKSFDQLAIKLTHESTNSQKYATNENPRGHETH